MEKITGTTDQQPEVLDPGQSSLQERAAEIDRKHRRFVRTASTAVQRLIALGHELITTKRQVREELGPRKWEIWREENTDVPARTAQLAGEFASREQELVEKLQANSATVADLSIREAKRILGPRNRNRDGEADENDHDADQPDGEGANGADKDGDGSDGDDTDDDGEQGDGDEDEDDPDARQFEALRRAYEDADDLVREAFHEHLREVYGLEVQPVQDQQQPEQPDDSAAAA